MASILNKQTRDVKLYKYISRSEGFRIEYLNLQPAKE